MVTRELLATYYHKPSADSLAALLQTSAHPVYNICFQVLRHRQDAEDTSQRVLLKIVEELRGGQKIEQFDHWLYRVAFTTALDARTQRARRAVHENRKALMSDTEYAHNDLRNSVLKAVAGLDDEACCLIVQHFFEARSLGDIARERGVSKMAVWKRVERAKDALRHSLQGVGALTAAAHMGEVFGAMTPTSAPPHLVSSAILQKAAEVAAARTAQLGGMAMAAKGISIATFATLAILLFVGGTGGALVLSSTLGEPPSTMGRPRQAPETGVKLAKGTPLPTEIGPKTAGIQETASAPPAPPQATVAALKSIRDLLREANATNEKEKGSARARDLYRRLLEEWSALRPTALAYAPEILAFLRERENEDIVSDLVGLVVNMVKQSGCYQGPGQDPQVPREVIKGLGEMLLSGSREQKFAVLHWLGNVQGDGKEMLADVFLTFLQSEREPKVLTAALMWRLDDLDNLDIRAKLEQRLDIVRNLWQNFNSVGLRAECLGCVAPMKSPAANELFLEKMQEILQDKKASLHGFIEPLRSRLANIALGEEDRYLPILKSALTRSSNADDFGDFLCGALHLPPTKAVAILEEARPSAPNASIKSRVERTLELLRGGETRIEVLYDTLRPIP